MSTENNTPPPADPKGLQTAPPDAAPTDPNQTPPTHDTSTSTWRHTGKIARLPKTVRDQINLLLEDGVSYPDIIQRLGDPGKHLSVMNLSRWKNGGHKDWLAEQAFIARTRALQETPRDLVQDFDATEVNHAALQLGTLHIFEALRDLGPGTLDQKLGGDSAAFARLLNALARASRETMLLQKYRDACARARAELKELKDPNRKLNESETRAIVLKVDDILGLNTTDGRDELRESPLNPDISAPPETQPSEAATDDQAAIPLPASDPYTANPKS
jgi:hypothetical protein